MTIDFPSIYDDVDLSRPPEEMSDEHLQMAIDLQLEHLKNCGWRVTDQSISRLPLIDQLKRLDAMCEALSDLPESLY